MNVHHVAYAVKNVLKAEAGFQALGYEREGEVVDDSFRHVRILFMNNGDTRIELVEPLDDEAPVKAILKKEHGASVPYHLCYEVDDIEAAVEELKGKGFMPTTGIDPAPAIDGRCVAFLFSRAAGLIELVQTPAQ